MDVITGTVCCFLLVLAVISHFSDGSESSSGWSEFGCPSDGSDSPYWSDEEIFALRINEPNLRALLARMERVYKTFMESTPYNNVDDFISFYHAFQASNNPGDFLSTYKPNHVINNINVAFLRAITSDETIMNLVPELPWSMFFAATIPKASPELVQTFNHEGYVVNDTTEYKEVTPAIKITLIGENEEREGYILLKPESIWTYPIKVFYRRVYPHTALMVHHQMVRVREAIQMSASGREFPLKSRRIYNRYERQFALGWKPLGIEYKLNFLNDNSKIIANTYPMEARFTGDVSVAGYQNPVIFVGKPYCGFELTSFKYDLVSPYRAILERDNRWTRSGIILTLTDTRPVFFVFSEKPLEEHDCYPIIEEDLEYELPLLEPDLEPADLAVKIFKIKELFRIKSNADFMSIIFENNQLLY